LYKFYFRTVVNDVQSDPHDRTRLEPIHGWPRPMSNCECME